MYILDYFDDTLYKKGFSWCWMWMYTVISLLSQICSLSCSPCQEKFYSNSILCFHYANVDFSMFAIISVNYSTIHTFQVKEFNNWISWTQTRRVAYAETVDLQKNRGVESWIRPESRWSNHGQGEADVTVCGGPNRLMLKNLRMTCG